MKTSIVYHTRHIPREHLDFSTRMGRQVEANGLCDVLEPDSIAHLHAYGIDTVELRLVWWEIEPEPGVFNWSRFERDLERVEHAGLKPGLMAWLNHPPAWYHRQPDRAACFTCLEHGRETTTLSPWDPQTLAVKDRLYRIIAERYGSRLDFIYVTLSGDYGEPVLPQGVKHYRFSPPHTHAGIFWSGDRFARASWRDYLQRQYASLAALNTAWQTAFAAWDDDLLEGLTDRTHVNTRRRLDYLLWITASTATYARQVYGLIRRHFPRLRAAVPIGHCAEAPNGQSKSLCVKAMATLDRQFTVRWTGMAVLGEFSRSNVLACRVSSIARFYGVEFGEEAALIIDAGNAAAALYEGLANGMSMLHNDIGNIRRAGTVSTELFDRMVVDPPVNTVALFYPAEQEMLEAFEEQPCAFIDHYIARAAELRHRTDYDICDALMIADGCLAGKAELVFVHSCVLPDPVVPLLEAFLRAGGRVTVCHRARVSILDGGQALETVLSPVTVLEGLPDYPAYEALKRMPQEFVTRHSHHVSRFDPAGNAFAVEPR
jgi:hypothetical protein